MGSPLRVGLAALASLAVIFALPAGGVAKSKPKPKPPTQAVVAKKLVAAVVGGKTAAARARGMVALMRALHIGVVSSAGKPIVTVPEPNAARLAELYDFELRGLAEQLHRKQTTTLDDLGTTLRKGGIDLDGSRPLPAALISEALRDATHDALAHPRREASLLPLVIRQLGLKRGFDINRTLDPATVKLDSLQAWLIAADLALPILRDIPLPGARALAAGTDLPDSCARFKDASEALQQRIEKQFGSIGKWLADHAAGKIYDKIADKLKREGTRWAIKSLPRWAVRGLYDAGRAAEYANPVIELVHGELLAYSVDVRALETALPAIHWWHTGNDGTKLTFRVKVTMMDDYGDTAVKCGSLLGFDVPPPGGIKDVMVTWTQAQNDLRKQGKLDCATVACITKTGDDGIARLVFTPNIEPLPGVGIEREDNGVIDGVALYQSAAGGGIAGGLAQFLTPKFGSTRWFVRSHQPRGLKFATPHEYPERPPTEGANIGYAVDAHMCGSAPYSTAWSGTRHTLMTGYAAQFPDKHVTFDDLLLTPGQPASPSRYPLYSSSGNATLGGFDVEILPGPPAQVRVRTSGSYYGTGPIRTYTVPLEEDLSCPPLP
jgi:hypothetical protein